MKSRLKSVSSQGHKSSLEAGTGQSNSQSQSKLAVAVGSKAVQGNTTRYDARS